MEPAGTPVWRWWRAAAAFLAVGVLAGGVIVLVLVRSQSSGPTIHNELRPAVSVGDPAPQRARSIADFIERKYALVEVWSVRTSAGGTVVSFALRMHLDPRSEHGDLDAWHAHVIRAARDHRQAGVEALKLTARFFPELRFASVWQDQMLTPFWSRDQILAIGDPADYRRFEVYQELVLSAEILPLRPS